MNQIFGSCSPVTYGYVSHITEACKSRRMRRLMRPHTMSTRMLHIETTCKIEASLFRSRITRMKTKTSAAWATRCARPMRAPPDRRRPRGSMPPYACHYQAMSLRSHSGPQNEINAALATSAATAAATLAARRAARRSCRASSRPSTTCDARKGQGVTRERPSESTG